MEFPSKIVHCFSGRGAWHDKDSSSIRWWLTKDLLLLRKLGEMSPIWLTFSNGLKDWKISPWCHGTCYPTISKFNVHFAIIIPIGGGISNIFYFHPKNWEKIPDLTNIFSNGWVQPTTYLWTPKPWKMKVLGPQYMGDITPKNEGCGFPW